jgi:4-amino-4-deoxy-L-arabinose transferase-like glycosyltransferase
MTVNSALCLWEDATSPPSRSAWRRSTVFILLLALAGRILVLAMVITGHPHGWFYNRPYEMGQLADMLVHGRGLSSPFGGSTGPTAFVAPGYPLLVALVFRVFGCYSFASVIAIVLSNILLNLLTLWMMMWLARRVLDDRTAVFAGAFWAISPVLLWIPTIFWETSLSACSLLAMILLALHCRRAPSLALWCGMGTLSALIALVNPALLPSLIAILGWTAWQTSRNSLLWPLAGLLVLLLVYSPWPLRNARQLHAFIPMRSTVGEELWMGNRPGATGYVDDSSFPKNNPPELSRYIAVGEVAFTRGKSDQAWQYVRQHPGLTLGLTLRRFYRFWAGTGTLNSSRLYQLHASLTSLFGFIGLWLLYRKRRRDFAALMALPLLLFPCPYYITHAEFRYRYNIDPVMTILAAYAVTQLLAAWSRRQRRTITADQS